MMTFPFMSHLTCHSSSYDELSILSQWTEDIRTSDIYPPRFLKRRSKCVTNPSDPETSISPLIKVEQAQIRKPVWKLMACQTFELSVPQSSHALARPFECRSTPDVWILMNCTCIGSRGFLETVSLRTNNWRSCVPNSPFWNPRIVRRVINL